MEIAIWSTLLLLAIWISSFITQRQISKFEEKFFENFWLNETNEFIQKYYKPSTLYKALRELKAITRFEWLKFKDKEIQNMIDEFKDVESKRTYIIEKEVGPKI